MAWIRDALERVAGDLTTAGVPAVVDPRELNAPGAWVTVAPISYDRLAAGVRTLQADVFLIARDLGTPDALDALADMLDLAAGVFPLGEITPTNLANDNLGGDPLPALQFRITLEIT